ncbi:MAG TPA: YihY/virulence factor BrkB family protein [Stellaceae bacterium]|jgi:membrane protein|nr:YihY/virulence factor BrkB family protein [Stellaceae bacterium]
MPANTAEHKEPPAQPHVSLWGPLRGLGVWQVLGRLWREMGRTNLSLMASALAFYGLLATFPALVVVITSFALLTDPGYIQGLLAGLQGIVPEEAWKLLASELKSLGAAPDRQVGLGLILGLAISLWSAHSASASAMEALNRIYGTQEERGLLTYHGVAFAFTLGGLCFGLAALAAVAIIPAVVSWLTLSPALAQLLSFIRWPVLGGFMIAAFTVLYRYAPYRKRPLWSRIFVGAGIATLLWLVGSALFSIYVGRFGSYDKTYGSIGAVIVLLMWFYVSAYTTLLGALLDAEMSRHGRHRHEPQP